MNYPIENIVQVCEGQAEIAFPGSMVTQVSIDHRDQTSHATLFAAIKGARTDGHRFIPDLIARGVRHFLITDERFLSEFKGEANFILVKQMVGALQKLSAHHRSHFDEPIVVITGSNGKTIVKEWLNDLLRPYYRICRSPKSFNSQIGVPLSVFGLDQTHTLGIFEAGISKPGEMQKLGNILKGTIGVFTNLGDAHAAHFESEIQKFREKWTLFESCQWIVCSKDNYWCEWLNEEEKSKLVTWSFHHSDADVWVESVNRHKTGTELSIRAKGKNYTLDIPFTDRASVENAVTCFTLVNGIREMSPDLVGRFRALQPVAMRMELKPGIENSIIIDDSYNADLDSLTAALEQLKSLPHEKKMVVLSGLKDGSSDRELYTRIAKLLEDNDVTEFIGIGSEVALHSDSFGIKDKRFFNSIDNFWQHESPSSFRDKAILIKGSRAYRLEELSKRLQRQKHETVLEIDLQKMLENLRYFRSQLKPETKTMVMVKAFSYGTGAYEVASFLENQKIDALAVAYTDEGVLLRQKGISLPIMVMSPTQSSHESMIRHKLEPEIYSMRSLLHFAETAKGYRHFADQFYIHIKFNTGMNRLGFEKDDLDELITFLGERPYLKVRSAFTHLSASDASGHDDFTKEQFQRFEHLSMLLEQELGYTVLKHALNSTGILRFPKQHYDMVRLGIGLYGFAGSESGKYLSALGKFKSYIAQIRRVKKGESVGYNRKGISDKERVIATIAVGYADGLDRRLGNGNWSIKWQGQSCEIVGDVCMDMCMIDISGLDAREGDEVIVFENAREIQLMAEKLGTIPYEILTKISPRVRRLYLQE